MREHACPDTEQMRRRVQWSVIVVVAVLGGCATGVAAPPLPTSVDPGVGWYTVPDLPVEPRDEPLVVWTGDEVLVVGGATGPPCPPGADCERGDARRDGAALDPLTGTWRRIADAPRDVGFARGAVVGEDVFVVVDSDGPAVLLSYRVAQDRWQEWPVPVDDLGTPVADGDSVVFVAGSHERGVSPDHVLDVATGSWSVLAQDPLGPAFDRVLTPTPDGLVLVARELVPDPGSGGPALAQAALLDRTDSTWTRLPGTGQIGGWTWTWTGTRLVAPELGEADGGEVNPWDRAYPYGGSIDLPDGGWSPLPNPPQPRTDAWVPHTLGDRFAASAGYVYDDDDQSWTPLARPEGGPDDAGAAVWAGDRLVVVGGVSWSGSSGTRDAATWVYVASG